MADFVRRRVAVIATLGSNPAALAAKAATTTIPIVFSVGEDAVRMGLVTSLARPGGNATGINFLAVDVATKRLALLHELVPKAVRIAVLVNPANASTAEGTLRQVPETARTLGLQIAVLEARTSSEIEAAFATLARDRADALFVAPDAFFISRRVQFATLAARHGIPAAYPTRDEAEAGGLMSYGVESRTHGIRSASTPVKSSRARSPPTFPSCSPPNSNSSSTSKRPKRLGIEIPNSLQLLADEVIEVALCCECSRQLLVDTVAKVSLPPRSQNF